MTTKKNLILIPSYKRPEKLKTCLNSILSNSVCSDAIVILNASDVNNYSETIEEYHSKNIRFMITEANSCPEKLNLACDTYGKDYEYTSFIGDDCVVITPRWDEMCIEHIERNFNGIGVVSPSEPSWGRNYDDLPLHWVQSRSFWTTVGSFVHREMKHCYVDNLIRDFANSIESYAKLSNCIIEHHHPNHGFASDEVYELGEKSHCDNDKKIYYEYINSSDCLNTLNRLKEVKNVHRPL
jgi:glycosyltransferase involved in cell wall biosynthesis